jgi:tripeptidyl-peptidase-1
MLRTALLVLVVLSASVVGRFVCEPKPHRLNGWTKLSTSPAPTTRHQIQLALSRPFQHVTTELYTIADPAHPRYGHYKQVQQVAAFTAPPSTTLPQVVSAFRSFGLKFSDHCSLVAGHSDWVQCDLSIAALEAMFACKFHNYAHPQRPGVILSRVESYSLPDKMAGLVDFVGSMKRLPTVRPSVKALQRRRGSGGLVTPTRSRTLWNVNVQGNSTNGQIQEIAQFLDQYITPSDLTQFWSTFNLPAVNYTIVGPNDPSNPGDEASLDIQTITGVNQGTKTQFTVTPGLHEKQEPFLVWLLAIAGTKNPPLVHSVSYGDDEDSLDDSYITRVDQEFQKLGLLGHTFVYASGDSGVDCTDSNTQQPDFPASSPHVVAVGGLVDLGTPVPRSWSGSGGGFSNFFPQPSFMNKVHQGYLNNPNNNVPPSSGLYNTTGRGYPDIAGIAMNVAIILGGDEESVGGTSCAAPAVSGIIALLNDVRISKGKPVLGYLNPLLYSAAAANKYIGISTGPANSAGDCQGFQPDVNGGWSPTVGFGGLSYTQFAALM